MRIAVTLLIVLCVAGAASADTLWGVAGFWDNGMPLGCIFSVDTNVGAPSVVILTDFLTMPNAPTYWAGPQSLAVDNPSMAHAYVSTQRLGDNTPMIGVVDLTTGAEIAIVAMPRMYQGMTMKDGNLLGLHKDGTNTLIYQIALAGGVPTGTDTLLSTMGPGTAPFGLFCMDDVLPTNPNSSGVGYYGMAGYRDLYYSPNVYTTNGTYLAKYTAIDYNASGEFDTAGQIWVGHATNYNLYNLNTNVNDSQTIIWDLSGPLAADGGAGIQGLSLPVPEPATLSVLALGALALLRRRRR